MVQQPATTIAAEAETVKLFGRLSPHRAAAVNQVSRGSESNTNTADDTAQMSHIGSCYVNDVRARHTTLSGRSGFDAAPHLV